MYYIDFYKSMVYLTNDVLIYALYYHYSRIVNFFNRSALASMPSGPICAAIAMKILRMGSQAREPYVRVFVCKNVSFPCHRWRQYTHHPRHKA